MRWSRPGRWVRRGAWVAVGILVFLPLALLLFRSFEAGGRFSLERYREIGSLRVSFLFLKSAGLSAAATLVALFLGMLLALLLETRRLPLRPAARLLALAPLLFPPYMHVAAWKPLLGSALLGGETTRMLLAVLILGGSYASLILFFASQGIRGISGEILDAARLSSRGEWQVALRIILPLSAPPISIGAAMTLVLVFLDQETPALLLVPTYATEIFLSVPRGAGTAFAMAAPAMLLLLLVVAGADFWARRRGFAVTWSENPRAPLAARRADPLTVAALSAFFGLLVLFPLARLLIMAGSAGRFLEALQLHGSALLEGIPITLVAAVGATALAAMAAGRSGGPAPPEALAAWLALAVPGAVLGAALIEVYNRPVLDSLYGSRWILVIAGIARFFPIAYHALAAHLRTVPGELWEAADLAALPAFRRLWDVYLPLAAPGLALAAAGVSVLQSGELAAAALLAPPGHRPVPVAVSSELHYNVDLEVPAALCLLQASAVLLLIGAITLLGRWIGKARR